MDVAELGVLVASCYVRSDALVTSCDVRSFLLPPFACALENTGASALPKMV